MKRTNSRSTARIAAVVLTGAVMAVGAGVVVAQQAGASPATASVLRASLPATPGPDKSTAVVSVPFAPFVGFDGKQAGAFETTFIPKGWKVQAADDSVLLLAPPGADQDPTFFLGKIAVSVGLSFPERKPAGSGAFVSNDADGSIVQIDLKDGNYLAVQFPPTTGGSWTDEERLEFARGIAVPGKTNPIAG